MRLFIAVPFPVLWMEWLARTRDHLRVAFTDDRRPLRWTPPEQWHITLQFLGECPDQKLPGVQAVIQEAASSFGAFRASLGDLGVFGGPRGATLWVGMKTGQEDLCALAGRLGEGLARQGFLLDKRPFQGHVTLARRRAKFPGKRLAHRPPLTQVCPESYLDQIVLFQSILGAGGARYETIYRHKLGIR